MCINRLFLCDEIADLSAASAPEPPLTVSVFQLLLIIVSVNAGHLARMALLRKIRINHFTMFFCRVMLCVSAAYAVVRCLVGWLAGCHVRVLCRNG